MGPDTTLNLEDVDYLYKDNELYKKAQKKLLLRKDIVRDVLGYLLEKATKFRVTNRTTEYSATVKFSMITFKQRGAGMKSLLKKMSPDEDGRFSSFPLPTKKVFTDTLNQEIENNFTLNIQSSLDCRLRDSEYFDDTVNVVETWTRNLKPGCTWDLSFREIIEDGINLSDLGRIIKDKGIDKDGPITYAFIMETIGDKRGKILRKSDESFTGTAPVILNAEFETELKYVSKFSEIETDKSKPVTSATSINDKEFNEEIEFEKEMGAYFAPDREEELRLPIQLIKMKKPKVLNGKTKEEQYTLVYEEERMEDASSALLKGMREQFRNHKLSDENITMDDMKFKKTLRKGPSEIEKEEDEEEL